MLRSLGLLVALLFHFFKLHHSSVLLRQSLSQFFSLFGLGLQLLAYCFQSRFVLAGGLGFLCFKRFVFFAKLLELLLHCFLISYAFLPGLSSVFKYLFLSLDIGKLLFLIIGKLCPFAFQFGNFGFKV